MNRKLLALAVTAALAAPFAAQAAPTLYGQLNLSIDSVDAEANLSLSTGFVPTEAIQVNSNASRLGVRGEEDLGNGLSAIYQAEWGVDASGDGGDLSLRDRFLGVKGGFGTVKVGAFEAPLNTSQGGVDLFDDMTFGDMGRFILFGEDRKSNVIQYESPKIADSVTVKVAVQPGETTGASDGLTDVISASVAYEANGLYAALGYQQGDDNLTLNLGDGNDGDGDLMRATVTYTMDALQLGAMYQTAEPTDGTNLELTSFLVSASYTMDKNVFKAQFVNSDLDGATLSVDAILLGVEHNYSQMTKAYVHASQATWDDGTDREDTVISLGMLTRF